MIFLLHRQYPRLPTLSTSYPVPSSRFCVGNALVFFANRSENLHVQSQFVMTSDIAQRDESTRVHVFSEVGIGGKILGRKPKATINIVRLQREELDERIMYTSIFELNQVNYKLLKNH
jgi:hypothetical protein